MTNEEEWTARVQACRESGLSAAAYCREHGLTVSSFRYWSGRLRQKAAGGVKVARVKKKAGDGAVKSSMGTLRLVSVEVPVGLSADSLRQVLSLFEAKK